MTRWRMTAVPALCLAAACGDASGGDVPVAVVRDSAGVAIVENPAPGALTPGWTVDSLPAVDIGMLEGPPEYQLESVWTTARQSDGTIVVPDAGAHTIRFYDATGRHVRSVGREGAGPGEFRYVGAVYVGAADSIFVWDGGERRLSVFAPNGDFVRVVTLTQPASAQYPLRPAAMVGRLLLTTSGRFVTSGMPSGVVRDTLPLYAHDPTGAVVDSLGPWPQNESFILSDENSVTVTSRAFGRSTSYAGSGEQLYVADPDRWQIEVHDTAGLRRIIRVDLPPRPVTAGDIEDLRASRLDEVEEQWRELTERLWDAMPFPETMPAYGRVIADELGWLWVADYDAREGDDTPTTWSVFDPEGRLTARTTTPAGFTPHAIGADWLLGTWRDELDVVHVRVHRLERATSSATDEA